jgi:putative hemolysin
MEVAIIAGLILLNGVFAMYEIALVSSNASRLEGLALKGNKRARLVIALRKEPENVLSTIQVGITLIGILSGAYGGIALSDDLTPYLQRIAWLAPHASQISFAVVITIITYFSLVVGELVPKSVALSHAEPISIWLSPFIVVLSKIAYPFVWLLSASTTAVNSMFGIRAGDHQAMSEDELKFLIKQSSESGVIDEHESNLIREVFRFGDKRANEIMTHRTDVETIRTDMTKEEVMSQIREAHFSKYPVVDESMDDVIGVVAVKDLIPLIESRKAFNVKNAMTAALFIPENVPVLKVLEMFKQKKTNFGVVIDEYGAVEGIVTLHDLTETLLGEIPEEFDDEEMTVVRRADGSYLVDGAMNIGDFLHELGMELDEELDNEDFNTLGGLAMYKLGRVPAAGDLFEHKRLKFEVMDMDKSRVDKLLVMVADDDV